ncbi:hypothetical protein [Vibrio breoganii]|uniref:hypothetical protein n=1 Tax=Vibrio breoganii TaxID=553239 RepID=UPI000C81DCBF|nr:hypothetical protein [Vibrio breoganii]PMK33048.1 hypothetical protein BCU03_04640 [Vibrio breoganii]
MIKKERLKRILDKWSIADSEYIASLLVAELERGTAYSREKAKVQKRYQIWKAKARSKYSYSEIFRAIDEHPELVELCPDEIDLVMQDRKEILAITHELMNIYSIATLYIGMLGELRIMFADVSEHDEELLGSERLFFRPQLGKYDKPKARGNYLAILLYAWIRTHGSLPSYYANPSEQKGSDFTLMFCEITTISLDEARKLFSFHKVTKLGSKLPRT